MLPPRPGTVRFQPTDNLTTLRNTEQARAFKEAMQLKADVEAARAGASEVFISQPSGMAKMGGMSDWMSAKQTLSSTSRGENGELKGFLSKDGAGAQYTMAKELAGGMIGGFGGGFLMGDFETYSRTTKKEDGGSATQTLVLDKTSGLMDFSEWQMPAFPGPT